MTEGRDSHLFFRRFKKRRVILRALFFVSLIGVFHTEIGVGFSDKSRFFLTSAKVALGKYVDEAEKIFLNFSRFLFDDVEGELLNLRNSNEQLREEIETLKHFRSENEELRKLLSLKESEQTVLKIARVVDVFSNDFARSIVLNLGKIDGISEEDVVKNSDGLVGRIIEVNDAWSRALLITDMNSGIPVKIGEIPVNAIMTGDNSDNLFISTIHEDIQINDGDEVRTSGYGICEDIYVGKILKTDKKNEVKSPVDFNSLKYVIIVSGGAKKIS
jgi:rod shape-determining protein MreC